MWMGLDPRTMQQLHSYDGHRTLCSVEDKATAGRLGGHSWNIISNNEQDEIYLRHARSSDHYVNNTSGETTSVWFDRRRRIPHPLGGLEGANWSANVREILKCPATPQSSDHGKARSQQLLQATAPRDYALFSARRREILPQTPVRPGHLERTLGSDQTTLRDLSDSLMPRMPKIVDRKNWTPRRGEARVETLPPSEVDMFSSIDQLKTESHVDVQQSSFAHQLEMSQGLGRSDRGLSDAAESCLLRAAKLSHRSSEGTPRHPQDRKNHSRQRIENFAQREISDWTLGSDKLLRKDPFCMRPMQQPNNSGVKYDIITGERGKFWY